MKKIFVCLLAVAALASCQKNQVISTVGGPAIAFENAFVDNATKADPSYNNAKLFDQFFVWGYMDQTSGIVFSGERVAKDGSIVNGELNEAWLYANTQYWAPNHTYTFEAVTATDYEAAIVNVTEATADVVSVGFVNADGTNDLLYATAEVKTGSDVSSMAAVPLTFKHLLSKVKFSFTNGFGNDNAYITVKNIKMTVPGDGVWDVKGTWTLGSTETVLAFGDKATAKVVSGDNAESQDERLTIPAAANQAYDVTFDVELYYGEVLAYSNTLLTVIEGVVLEAGKAYNFHATIDASNIVPGDGKDDALKPIEFTATVSDWESGAGWDTEKNEATTGGTYNGGVIDTSALPIFETTEVAAGTTTVLTGDAVIPASLKVAGTLDGAGYALHAAAQPANNGLLRPEGDATIKNLTIDGEGASTAAGKTLRGLYINKDGNYVIENVTITGCGYALNCGGEAAPEAATLKVSNSTFESWTSYTSTVTAEFTNVAFTKGAYAMFRPYGTTVLTNCSFEEGFIIDLAELAEGKTIKFVNCTYAGAALNADNLTGAEGKDVTIE